MKRLILLWAFLVGVAITSTQEAGSEVSGRIYLGSNASIAMFPWMVGVTQMGDNGKFETYRCGGALISRNLILTSADCVQGTRAVRITLGSSLAGALTDADGKVTRHATLHYKRGDLCVVRLNESVTFVRDRIQPVRLPIASDVVGEGVAVYLSGWGGTKNGTSRKLQYTIFETLSKQTCASYWSDLVADDLCAINYHSAACWGDNGSPVVHINTNRNATLVGILKSVVAGPCGNPDYPVKITRTNMYVDWITSEIRRHST